MYNESDLWTVIFSDVAAEKEINEGVDPEEAGSFGVDSEVITTDVATEITE